MGEVDEMRQGAWEAIPASPTLSPPIVIGHCVKKKSKVGIRELGDFPVLELRIRNLSR